MSAFGELTYPGVALVVLAEQLCLPVPSGIFLMAAGALAAGGKMHPGAVIGVSIAACLAADGVWFWFGRRWGSQAMRLVCRLSSDPRKCAASAHDKFGRYGLALVCVARFIPGLGTVLPPLAAAEGAAITRFMVCDTLSGFLWSGFYTGLGYFFSSQLDVAILWVKQFGTAAGISIGLPITLYASWRGVTLLRMIRRLRLRRISPPMLARKLKSGRKVAVLDLLDFEQQTEGDPPEAVPGSLRVDPDHLRKSPPVAVPDDVDVVLYSSSGNDAVSARVAIALSRIGVKNVWVMGGGLKAWRELGLPVAKSPDAPDVFAERVGVHLPLPGRFQQKH